MLLSFDSQLVMWPAHVLARQPLFVAAAIVSHGLAAYPVLRRFLARAAFLAESEQRRVRVLSWSSWGLVAAAAVSSDLVSASWMCVAFVCSLFAVLRTAATHPAAMRFRAALEARLQDALHLPRAVPTRPRIVVGIAVLFALLSVCLSLEVFGLLSEDGTASAAAVALRLGWMLCGVVGIEFVLSRAPWRTAGAQERDANSPFDALTGLPGRPSLQRTLAELGPRALEDGVSIGLLYLGVDDFKQVNEAYGHAAGDFILRAVADRIREAAQAVADDSDEPVMFIAGRVSGDEFALVVHGDLPKAFLASTARRLLDTLRKPYMVDGTPVAVEVSVGIASYPSDGPVALLLGHGDAAMKTAKASGGRVYSYFQASLVDDARDRIQLVKDLRVALKLNQFELVYQPKVEAVTGKVTAAEALLRWHHPDRGTVSPTVFIPLAERYGLIVDIGDWVIEEACRQARVWLDAGLRMRVAINLSTVQMRQPTLVDRITEALSRHGVDPDRLTCEITESLAMEDKSSTFNMLLYLGAAGVHVSIDDFGTGYSSLAYLRELPATEIKIDRSFVMDLPNAAAATIVGTIVSLGHSLGLKVVAEGVETEEQHAVLVRLGCDELQGFLFARPMAAKAITLWAMDSKPGNVDFRDSMFVDSNFAVLA